MRRCTGQVALPGEQGAQIELCAAKIGANQECSFVFAAGIVQPIPLLKYGAQQRVSFCQVMVDTDCRGSL